MRGRKWMSCFLIRRGCLIRMKIERVHAGDSGIHCCVLNGRTVEMAS